MSRLPPVDTDDEDEAIRRVFALLESDGREPSPLYRTLAHAPKMLAAWAAMARPLRSDPSISRRLRELMVMRTAQVTRAPYEWAYHREAALSSGVTEEQLETLEAWWSNPSFDERERVVLAYTESMLNLDVDDITFRRLASHFDPQEIVELTVIAAFYSGVSRVLQALQIEVDAEHSKFLPRV